MLSNILTLVFLALRDLPSFALSALTRKIAATFHFYTYKPLPAAQTKNVIVIGGSYTGYYTAKHLKQTLPAGYRVVLIERNSHFNYVFALPRFSVIKGYERYAFIPYTALGARASEGVFEFVQGKVKTVDRYAVRLENGDELEYEYLVIATGTSSTLPSKVAATERLGAQRELKGLQDAIEKAARVAIVGGGAVGVETASDIKDFHPSKSVVLFHSRDKLLPNFGQRLQHYVMKRLDKMGVDIRLNERPQIVNGSHTLTLEQGKEETFDLIVSHLYAIEALGDRQLIRPRFYVLVNDQTAQCSLNCHQARYQGILPTSLLDQHFRS